MHGMCVGICNCSPASIQIKGTYMGVYSVSTVYHTPGSKNTAGRRNTANRLEAR